MSTLTEIIPPPATIHDLAADVWDFSVPVDLDNHARSPRHGPASSSLKSRKASHPINSDVTLTHNRINSYNSRSSDSAPITSEAPAFFDTPKSSSLRRNSSSFPSNHDGDPVLDTHSTSRMSAVASITRKNSISDDDSKWIDRDKLARIEGQDFEATKWIDRDKLAQIESKEMAQAGILLPLKGKRSSSKTLETHNHTQENTEQRRQRVASPAPDSSEDDQEERFVNYDPRHPSEIAMDNLPHAARQSYKNGSKIPRSLTSPIPVRQQILERTAPLVRQPPSPDQGSDEDDIPSSYIRSRRRSYSASSAVMLNGDSESSTTATTAKPTRGTRSQSQTITGIASPGRKNSTQAKRTTNPNLGKNRSRSNPQLNGTRPSTASTSQRDSGSQPGSSGKGHPHHVPEGPPPWSLSAYSPDPKLPPEEQLIPTVAKRLQQEQWEKEGKFATVYDGKLRPLKVEEGIDPDKSEYKHQAGSLPHTAPTTQSEALPPTNEGQEKPVSRIPNGAPQISPKIPRSVSSLNGPGLRVNGVETTICGPPSKYAATPPDAEKRKEKSKFCCCIVM